MKILILFTLIAVINAQNGTNTTKNVNTTTNSTGTTTPIRTTTSSLLRGTTTSFHSTTISATTSNPSTTTTQQSTTTDISIATTTTRPIEKTTIIPTTTIIETTTFIQTTTVTPYCNNETMNTSCIKCVAYLCKYVERGSQGVGMELLFLGAFIGFVGLSCLMVYYYCIKPVIYHNIAADIYWSSDEEEDEATLLSRHDIDRKTTPPGIEMTREQ